MLSKCKHCNHEEMLSLNFVPIHERFHYECGGCGRDTGTGVEEAVRRQLETRVAFDLPRITSMRAIALAHRIYNLANQAKPTAIKMSKTTTKALNKAGGAHEIVAQWLIYGRTWQGLLDDSLGAAVVVYKNYGQLPEYSIYVVFRGSVGDGNKGNAGFMSKAHKVNVDWRANFDNKQEPADWGGGGFMVHGGYKSIVGSYRDRVFQAISDARRRFPFSNVVVTGHSQGAGHAVLFTHWLACKDPHIIPNLFAMPFSPPRVGDYRFAQDFNERITYKKNILPYDGETPLKSYFVVRGHDPVSFDMEHGYDFKNFRKYADKTGIIGLIKKGLASQSAERSDRIESQVYFHPSCLKILPGAMMARGQGQILNHKHDEIRNIIRNQL